MPTYEIHISDVNTFKQCRRLWNWASPLRQNLEPDRPYAPFFLGSIVHDTLELYYSSENDIEFEAAMQHAIDRQIALLHQQTEIWPADKEMMEEQIDLARGILSHYYLWINGQIHKTLQWPDDAFEFISIEHAFDVPFLTASGNPSNKVYYSGRFDGLARHKETGSLWVWENKTARSIQRLVDTLWNAPQATAYVLAAQRLFPDEKVEGIIYNVLRKKVPATAPVLKNGTLSRAANVSTTFEWYSNQIRHQHPRASKAELLDHYRDRLRALAQEPNEYFQRVAIARSQHQLNQFERDLHAVALEMSRDTTPIYPNPSLHCDWCRFKEPCHALDAGYDVDLLLRASFRERSPRVPPNEEILSDD